MYSATAQRKGICFWFCAPFPQHPETTPTSQKRERRWKHGLEDNFFFCLRLPKTPTKNSAVICVNLFAVLESELLYFKWHKYGNKQKPNVDQ